MAASSGKKLYLVKRSFIIKLIIKTLSLLEVDIVKIYSILEFSVIRNGRVNYSITKDNIFLLQNSHLSIILIQGVVYFLAIRSALYQKNVFP